HPALHRVVAADFVTMDSGTGVVHLAPAFGEDDHSLYRRLLALHADLPLLCAVLPDGTFVPEFTPYAGRWVKEADKDIQRELGSRGLLVHHEVYRHEYPFCWRSEDDPLIQYARPAWYIRTTARIDEAIANNQHVRWLPEHIKTGRFGDFLANNVDWALSRERFWGTPLNVWINDVSGKQVVFASVEEILAKNPRAFDHFHTAREADPTLSEHLIVHKPWIDSVTFEEPGEEGVYRRVPEVIDCWFDSGCMPFAQWGFPHQGREIMGKSYPADFISEAIDQTRGWFYSLLMIATLVFDEDGVNRLNKMLTEAGDRLLAPELPRPFKTCMVLGHVTDREGKKESKSKGNYTPPDVILDRVRMEFAVLAEHGEERGAPGVARIAREDLDGLDLKDGAEVRLFGHGPEAKTFVVRAAKKLPRRVVLLAREDIDALGAKPTEKKDVRPVEVPSLPARERVWVEDMTTPAPGADAFRWFFFASNPPWNATRHSLQGVRDLQKETLVKLRNVYSFFCIYANVD
ncbi:MAG: isoleucine--tRNA ligase, partial [Proteobacteria bacterium]